MAVAQAKCFEGKTLHLFCYFELSVLFLECLELYYQISTRNFFRIIFQILFTKRFGISACLFFFIHNFRMNDHLTYPILTLNQCLALLSFDLAQKLWSASSKLLMGKFTVLAISSNLMEAIHVKLSHRNCTCRTKLEKLECLKQSGSINS